MTDRIEKVNEVVKETIGNIILKEQDIPSDTLLTITRVKTLPNLQETTIYISVMPKNKDKDILQDLEANVYDIQKKFNKKLHLKSVPKLKFKIDKQAYAEQKVYELLAKEK